MLRNRRFSTDKKPDVVADVKVVAKEIFLYIFLHGIHSMQGLTATTRHRITRKKNAKRLNHTGNLFRKNLQLKGVCEF